MWAKYNSCSFADLNRIAKRLLQESDDLPDILSMVCAVSTSGSRLALTVMFITGRPNYLFGLKMKS